MEKNENNFFEQDKKDKIQDPSYVLYNQGVFAMEQGDFEKAYGKMVRSAIINPHFKTYERLYAISLKIQKKDEAFSYIEKAFELNPNSSKTATLYAQELVGRGELIRAKTILVEVLIQNSTYGPAHKLLDSLD